MLWPPQARTPETTPVPERKTAPEPHQGEPPPSRHAHVPAARLSPGKPRLCCALHILPPPVVELCQGNAALRTQCLWALAPLQVLLDQRIQLLRSTSRLAHGIVLNCPNTRSRPRRHLTRWGSPDAYFASVIYDSYTNGTTEDSPTEVVPKAERRRFGASYKLRMLDEADACVQPGALLRRESLYSLHLVQWRRQRDRGSLYGSTQAGKELLAKDEEIRRLRMELHQSRRGLEKAEAIIEVQKRELYTSLCDL